MTLDIMIENGIIVTANGMFKANLAIDEGKIVGITKNTVFEKCDLHIDAKRKLILPGGIDTHTHFEFDFMGEKIRETWHQGTTSAAFGGTTTVVDFSVQKKGRPLMKTIETDVSRADALSAIDFSVHGCFTDFSNPEKILKEMKQIVDFGVASFKEFMIYKKQGWCIDDWNLYNILLKAAELNAIVGVHAENASIGESYMDKLVEEGKTSAKYHPVSKPNFVEAEAIQRAIILAENTGSKLYIVHMSTKEGLELVCNARKRGLPVYAETCPHYLTLTDETYARTDAINYICSPPLRKNEDIDALWKGLAAGSISIVGSDHVAFTSEQKKEHSKAFTDVPNGIAGVEARLPILYSEGVRKGRISLQRLVQISSTNASKLLGIYPKKGVIAPGSDADIVIFDPDTRKTLSADSFHMGTDYSIYEGLEVRGYPVVVLSKGKVIIEDGQYLGEAGDGSFLQRKLSEEEVATFEELDV
jgi:dihydropyrimidinase